MSAVGLVLARLDDVRQTGDGWRARCPSCSGTRTGSLSVREGDDGRALLHDFRGCSLFDIVAAVGLKVSDLFVRPAKRGAGGAPLRATTETELLVMRLLDREIRSWRRHTVEREWVTRAGEVRDHQDAADRWRRLAARLAATDDEHEGAWDLFEVAAREESAGENLAAAIDAAMGERRRRS